MSEGQKKPACPDQGAIQTSTRRAEQQKQTLRNTSATGEQDKASRHIQGSFPQHAGLCRPDAWLACTRAHLSPTPPRPSVHGQTSAHPRRVYLPTQPSAPQARDSTPLRYDNPRDNHTDTQHARFRRAHVELPTRTSLPRAFECHTRCAAQEARASEASGLVRDVCVWTLLGRLP